jgi:hypothetical protein
MRNKALTMKQDRPLMRIAILLFILIVPIVSKADELTNELTKAVEQAQATKHYLDGLTTNDVPANTKPNSNFSCILDSPPFRC